ncbi:HAD hydrolase-like protein [Micromonospora sp. WMMD1082]|uniref:HAD family hydrolase n=1 Tax=Micromonospora sp. WMMD1082 TaxID=3016104 RepID=UPI0024176261|nr:HAD hydrolase-like protein [Micromonospora sp. WMMD1082]MDG4795156.1 HAD hydrolase-like protein [Micromonospora sp. WMMD1082]
MGWRGRQPDRPGGNLLRALELPVDAVATSGEWGVAKPDPRFFARVIEFAPSEPGEILYVGDHRDYDVRAAQAAGLRAALIKRGPWGHLWANDPALVDHGVVVLESLAHLAHIVPCRTSPLHPIPTVRTHATGCWLRLEDVARQ